MTRRLVRDVKMLNGAVFFEHLYKYYPSGKLSRVSVTNPDGVVNDARVSGRRDSGDFFW